MTGVPVPPWTHLSSVLQVDSSIALSDEASLVDAETSSSSVSSSTTVSTQSSGKCRKPPKVLQISPPTLLVTASDFSPMSLCSPSLPTASLTPAMIPVSVWGGGNWFICSCERQFQCRPVGGSRRCNGNVYLVGFFFVLLKAAFNVVC